MTTTTGADPACVTRRLVRFIAREVNRAGMRTRLVNALGTDYKRINRFINLQDDERPSRDLMFTMEILSALGFDASEVLDAATLSATPEDMNRRLAERRRSPPHKPGP